MNATGRCLCGAVTFTAEGVDKALHVCHCSMCRRWAGGPTFCMSVERVAFRGDDHIGRFESSAWAERGFCTRCGSSLFYRLKEPDQYILNMGSFDDPTPFEVANEIYVDDKPPGYSIAGTHPRMTGDEFLASLKPQ
jgi:hypothetical protein